MSWLYSQAPTPMLAQLLLLLLLGAFSAGLAIRRRYAGATDKSDDDGGEGVIMSASLGLLALLLGFTFALAVDRFDSRRGLVLQEANAIGTTYLRAQLLDDPYRSRISDLLRLYASNRLALAEARTPEEQKPLLVRSDRMQQQLWNETVTAVRPIRSLEIASTFIESMNQTIDIGAARKAARRAHVPNRVLTALLLYMVIATTILGYVMAERRAKPASVVLILLLTLAFLLILDIDRPTRGGVTESQAAMQDLVESLKKSSPQTSTP